MASAPAAIDAARTVVVHDWRGELDCVARGRAANPVCVACDVTNVVPPRFRAC